MDAVMYVFRENTSLGRLKSNRVGFMHCLFSQQIQNVYNVFIKKKRGFQWEDFYKDYANGELPSHGRTKKRWLADIDCIYTVVNVSGCHWISLCINFIRRTIEVFDCGGSKGNAKEVEPFRVIIPYLVKLVQPAPVKKTLTVLPYEVRYAHVQGRLNRSASDCGVYALKYMECHLHGLDISLINDENIREARTKIAFDLWQAANDPIFKQLMSNYVPAESDPTIVEIDS